MSFIGHYGHPLRYLLLSIVISFYACSLPVGYGAEEKGQKTFVQESLDDVGLITATGLGGALIGLSTLSFKKNPREHLRHILVGGSIGIIVGVAIVAWTKASKSHMYEEDEIALRGNFPVQDTLFSSSSSLSSSAFSYQQAWVRVSEMEDKRPSLTSSFLSSSLLKEKRWPMAIYWSHRF
jgi:hypothetical protein